MANEFLIDVNTDPTPATWVTVESLLAGYDISLDALNWSHEDFSRYERIGNGYMKGYGLPIVRWTFRALKPVQRENLRDYCTSLTSEVYIRTPSNETAAGVRIWKDYLCLMNWVTRAEVMGYDAIEEVEIVFTRCIAQ